MNIRRLNIIRGALAVVIFVSIIGGYLFYRWYRESGNARRTQVWAWFANPSGEAPGMIEQGAVCGDTPFIFPTKGVIGVLWGDSFRPGHTHTGLDIFPRQPNGVVPIIAAYPGYLTRLAEWKSTVIIRIPSDPLNPGRQIWTYYTHLADEQGSSFVSEAFPPGTSEVFVEAGTFLGFQGNFSGTPGSPTGVHLHFSIVKDEGGAFTNELEIENTYDPSPYFNMSLNAATNPDTIPTCQAN